MPPARGATARWFAAELVGSSTRWSVLGQTVESRMRRPGLRTRLGPSGSGRGATTARSTRHAPRCGVAAPPGAAKRTVPPPWGAPDEGEPLAARRALACGLRMAAARARWTDASAGRPRPETHPPEVGTSSESGGWRRSSECSAGTDPSGDVPRDCAARGAVDLRSATRGRGCSGKRVRYFGAARTPSPRIRPDPRVATGSSRWCSRGSMNAKGATALVTGCGCRCTTSFEGSEQAQWGRASFDRETFGSSRRTRPETLRTP